jgi:hypothetical protein
MVRTIALSAMGGGFMLISQPFRMSVLGGVGAGVNKLQAYSPYSYIALGLLLTCSAAYSVFAPQRPR